MPRAADGWTRWPAPAKLNLFLHIVGRRPDGYHRLQTVFQLLDWGDDVELRVREDGQIIRRAGAPGVEPEVDLAIRAARALQRATGTRLGADVRVNKRVPLGGGFGGGSSDAASVLVGLDCLWRTRAGFEALAELGLALGADVPVFVRGRSAWAEGVGDALVPLTLPPRLYLLLESGVSVPTAELFQAPDLTRDAAPATIEDFVSGLLRGNAFEPVLRRRAPAVASALDALGAWGVAQLTGTGGGMFAAFDDPDRAEAARAALASRWKVRIARGVNESPLLRVAQAVGCGSVPTAAG